jgi:hypothetical protein
LRKEESRARSPAYARSAVKPKAKKAAPINVGTTFLLVSDSVQGAVLN